MKKHNPYSFRHRRMQVAEVKPGAPLFAGNYLWRLVATGLFSLPVSSIAALTSVDGMTDAERNTATMIQDLCPKMVTANAATAYTGNEQRLFFECRALVQTSNALPGEAGLTGFSLGYDNDQLREALSQVAHQEVAVEASAATETIDGQFDTIASRMSALRRGGPGSGLGGLSLLIDGQTVAGDALFGGAAGDGANMNGWSIYLNGNYGFGDKESTTREVGFDYDNYGLTLGIDRQIGHSVNIGAAIGASQTKSDISQNGGTTEDDSRSISMYGTFQLKNNAYIDSIITSGKSEYDTLRRIRMPAPTTDPSTHQANTDDDISASTEGDQIAFSFGVGRDYHSATRQIDYGFFGRAQIYRSKIDAYRESGTGTTALELDVNEQVVNSRKLSIGAQISKSLSKSFGVIVPQARLEYLHEFDKDSRNITARYVHTPSNVSGDFHFFVPTDNPDRDFAVAGIGASAVLQSGLQLFGFYEAAIGLRDMTNNAVIFGVRGEL